ncbi:hypothetical protein BH20ACT13_BH20ACT13_21860 [soil metagenome]
MHRQKTKFRDRVNRVANALEKRGIRATYELHDRVLSNRTSRRRFSEDLPELDDVQQRIVTDVDTQGYAVLPFSDLVGAETSSAVENQGDRFAQETEDALEREGRGEEDTELRRRAGKEFLVRAHSFEDVELGLDDPWLAACISPCMLDVASAYLRLWPKLSYADLWYSIAQPEATTRVASQLWHRDFDDKHLLKAFLYLRDVDEGAGPFEYVPESHPGGRFEGVSPWRPMGNGRVPEDEVARAVPTEQIRTFIASRGTIIFCNTSGLHRGGFATEKPRILATATYCSPASLAALSERNYRFSGALDELDARARFAVS